MASAVKMPSIAQMQNIVDKAQAVKSTVLFPRWKDVPAVAGARSKAKDLAGQHARLLASDKPDGRAQAQKVWTSLASVYWELLFALLDAQTAPRAGRLPARLSFDETERLFIDFGILADGTLPFHRDFDAGMTLGSRCEAGIFPYLSFSDFIAECWAMILGAPAPAPVAGPAASERVKLLQEQLDKAQFRRDDLVMEIADEFVPNTPLDLRKLTSDMDRFLTSAMKVLTRAPEYREASESARQGILQERAAYLEAEKSVLLMISSAKQNAANPLPQPHMERVLGFHERTKVLAKKILYCQNDARKIARRAKKITDACSGLSAQMKRGELKNMLVK
ncbi:MAG: hypothetical protein IJ702_05275, partial [Fretibacterium sp.]|nr:hypothetical protein [Fretibacterium sp.]